MVKHADSTDVATAPTVLATSHTAGPWRATLELGLPVIETADGSVRIASVTIHGGIGRLRSANADAIREQVVANSHLLAAAPDLYASLREFVTLYDHTIDLLGDSVKAKLQRARAALKKAEGR